MDSIARGVILDLRRNCRTSLKRLSDKYGVSPNAIRKRITNLEQKGVIGGYTVELSRAMMDSEIMFTLIYTDKSIDEDTFAEMVFAHPLVIRVHYDSFGSCIVQAEFSRAHQMNELSSFFRRLESVTEVEVHTLPLPRGQKNDLTNLQLRILAPLLNNPRMRIAEIAKHTSLTARRVRRTLNELIESESILFTIKMYLTSSDASYIAYRLRWDSKIISPIEIEDILREKFPEEFWRLNYSAADPIIWCDFLIGSNRVSEIIVQEMRKIPSVEVRNTILVYPHKKSRSLRHESLRKIVEEAGYL